MKIYTKTGDSGETGLYGGQRVPKDDRRVEAYGTVDEANALLGLVAAKLTDQELIALVSRLQSELFVVGGDLATPLSRGESVVPRVNAEQTLALETEIDRHEAELEPLQNFILPGGTEAAATLHLARTVVRRAERGVVSLLRESATETNPEVLRYLNRLADLLFVLARVANRRENQPDVPWRRP